MSHNTLAIVFAGILCLTYALPSRQYHARRDDPHIPGHNMTALTIAALFDPTNAQVTEALNSKDTTLLTALLAALESNTLAPSSSLSSTFDLPSSNSIPNGDILENAPPDPTDLFQDPYHMTFQHYALHRARSPTDIAPDFAGNVFALIGNALARQPQQDLDTLWPTDANPEPIYHYGEGAPLYTPELSFTANSGGSHGPGRMTYRELMAAVRMWGGWMYKKEWGIGVGAHGVAGCEMIMVEKRGEGREVPILGAGFVVGRTWAGVVEGPMATQ